MHEFAVEPRAVYLTKDSSCIYAATAKAPPLRSQKSLREPTKPTTSRQSQMSQKPLEAQLCNEDERRRNVQCEGTLTSSLPGVVACALV